MLVNMRRRDHCQAIARPLPGHRKSTDQFAKLVGAEKQFEIFPTLKDRVSEIPIDTPSPPIGGRRG